MVGTMLLAVSLWVFGDALGIASVVAAMISLSILLLSSVLDWDDCLSEKSAMIDNLHSMINTSYFKMSANCPLSMDT